MVIISYSEIALFIIYLISISSIIYFALRKPKRKLCKTCKYWNFKVSGEDNVCWGNCFHNRMDIIRVSLPVEYRLAIKNSDKEYITQQDMKDDPYAFIDIYFNENEFGCIYHKKR